MQVHTRQQTKATQSEQKHQQSTYQTFPTHNV